MSEINQGLVDDACSEDLKRFLAQPKELKALMDMVYRLENEFGMLHRGNGHKHAHTHISSSYGELGEQLDIARQLLSDRGIEGRKFLDIGCGIGTKVAFAENLGWDAYGLECRARYVGLARELCGDHWIIRHDAMKFKGFADYDVLFFYWPVKDGRIDDFLHRVAEKSRKPSVIISSTLWGMPHVISTFQKAGIKLVGHGVFLKA